MVAGFVKGGSCQDLQTLTPGCSWSTGHRSIPATGRPDRIGMNRTFRRGKSRVCRLQKFTTLHDILPHFRFCFLKSSIRPRFCATQPASDKVFL
jgi:hypothetical protein